MFQDVTPSPVKYDLAWISIIGTVCVAIATIIGAIITYRLNRKNQRDLESHQRENCK